MKSQEEIQQKINELLEEGLNMPSSKGMEITQLRDHIKKMDKITDQVEILSWVLLSGNNS